VSTRDGLNDLYDRHLTHWRQRHPWPPTLSNMDSDNMRPHHLHDVVCPLVTVQVSDSPLHRSIFYARETLTIVPPLPATAHPATTMTWQHQHADLDDVVRLLMCQVIAVSHRSTVRHIIILHNNAPPLPDITLCHLWR
jgi:hypothetical protein